MPAAVEELERLESGAGVPDEGPGWKPRMNARDIRREATDEGWREEGLERVGHDSLPQVSAGTGSVELERVAGGGCTVWIVNAAAEGPFAFSCSIRATASASVGW